jgi:AraC-like DNA-binding protein
MTDPVSPDWSEEAEGPGLVVFPGSDAPGLEFRLGTQEYDWHHHVRGQLFCVESGMLHVWTAAGSWMLPPHRAGWMPPGLPHRVSVHGAMTGWTILVAPRLAIALPATPGVVGVSELMRALVRRAVAWPGDRSPEQDRQAEVLLDEVRLARPERLHLPMPEDPRLNRIAAAFLSHPADRRSLDAWARWGGISARSLRRLFLQETGLRFGQWRRQARLILSLDLLAKGQPVNVVSDSLGYETPSSFIAMFKRSFGVTPGQLFTT